MESPQAPQATLPGRLAVVLKNARAVREVYDYVAGDEIEKDLKSARQALVKHLCRSLEIPDGWRRPYLEDDTIWLHPDRKWNVPGKDTIAVAVQLPSPVPGEEEDWDASVNLYVPSWKPRKPFTDSLRPIVPRAEDWQYIRDFEPGEMDPAYPMWHWLQYEDCASTTDFDTPRFFQAVTDAVGQLLKLETEIDRLFEATKAKTAALPRKQSGGGPTRRERKPR
jgi:hypothetical protein